MPPVQATLLVKGTLGGAPLIGAAENLVLPSYLRRLYRQPHQRANSLEAARNTFNVRTFL